MTDSTPPTVPAGWYPDPDVPGGQRWWSGIGWTEYRTPPAAAPQYATSQYSAPQHAYAPAAAPVALPPDAWPYVGQPAPLGTVVPLWAPLYGATMGQAWNRFWRKYADFSGRASRSEFWFAYLWFFILMFGSYFVFAILFALVAFFWPGATILSFVLFFSAYMLVDGVFAIVAAVRAASNHQRWGLLVLGASSTSWPASWPSSGRA